MRHHVAEAALPRHYDRWERRNCGSLAVVDIDQPQLALLSVSNAMLVSGTPLPGRNAIAQGC
jgi:hypothetical protein